jgi:hypothetical protein
VLLKRDKLWSCLEVYTWEQQEIHESRSPRFHKTEFLMSYVHIHFNIALDRTKYGGGGEANRNYPRFQHTPFHCFWVILKITESKFPALSRIRVCPSRPCATQLWRGDAVTRMYIVIITILYPVINKPDVTEASWNLWKRKCALSEYAGFFFLMLSSGHVFSSVLCKKPLFHSFG